MIKRLLGLILGLHVGLGTLHAQLTEGDTLRWKAQGSLSSSWTQGNVERYLALAEVAGSKYRPPWGFQASLRYLYGTFGSFRTENDLSARSFAYHRPDRRLYPFAMLLAESHLRRHIDYRLQGGLGGSFRVWQRQQGLLKFSLSATAERTDYAARRLEGYGPLQEQRLEVLRLTARVAGFWNWFGGRLTGSYEAWGQQSLTHAANRRFFAQAGLAARIAGEWSLQSRLLYVWEAWVPPRVAAYDLFWTFGLTWQIQKT